MPKGETENLLLFMVPKAHHVVTLNGCHQDAGHQGHDQTLSLLQEHFWWLGMVGQVQKSLKFCTHCLQHEGRLSKAPLHPIVSTAPMDLLHVDVTSIGTTMEPNRPPKFWTSWCCRTISKNTLWHTWPLTRLQKQLPSFSIWVTSRSLGPQPGS